jgi:hypothetical protein
VRVHSFALSYILGSMRCDSRDSLLARTLASLCHGRKPKVKVAIIIHSLTMIKNCNKVVNLNCVATNAALTLSE